MVTSSKALKIAYVVQNAGNNLSEDTGPAILIKYNVRGLQKAGHQVTLMKLKGSSVSIIDDVFNVNDSREALLGLSGTKPFKLAEGGIRRLQNIIHLPYFAIFDTFRFYEACVRNLTDYTVCHEYHGLFSIGAALACLRLKLPYVITSDADLLLESKVIGKPLHGFHALVAAWVTKINYQLAQKIICVSEPAKQHLIDNWHVEENKIVVVPNGVDIDRFRNEGCNLQTIRKRLKLDIRNPIVAFIGSFLPWHGIDKLLESFVLVLQTIPEAKLLLVGDGPVRPIIEQNIKELGISDRIIMTGLVSHDQIPDMLAVADIVTAPYPSLPKEMWFSPLKLFEYMAAGKAIAASRTGQIAQVIQHNHTGLLVESGDVVGLSEAIITLIKNPALRQKLGRNAKQQALERHSWGQYTKQLEDIYYSIL